MKFKQTDQFKVSSEVLAQEVNGETVLLNLDGEGTRVWQLLQDQLNVASLVDSLFADYDVSREQLESDVDALLSELLKDGLVAVAKKE